MQNMMQQLKLTVNEQKTHICMLPAEQFDFLGYTFGRMFSPRTGRPYLGVRPSRAKIQSGCRQVSEMTSRRWSLMTVQDRVTRLNSLLQGWANYFSLGTVSRAYRAIGSHVSRRLRRWLCANMASRVQEPSGFPTKSSTANSA